MKKIFYLLSITFIILQSCSTDSASDSNTPDDSVVLIKSIIRSHDPNTSNWAGGNNQRYDFFYNGSKLDYIDWSFIDENGTLIEDKIIFTYNGNLISKVESFNNNTLMMRETYTYNNSQQIMETNQFSRDEQTNSMYHQFKSLFTYNPDGTVTELFHEGTENYPVQYYFRYTYTIADGEIRNVIEARPNGSIDNTKVFSYDNKNNPFKNVTGINLLMGAFNGGRNYNVIQETVNSSAGSSNTITYTYSYNSDNYPVSISSSFGSQSQTITYY
jgi:hypothetical protein